MIVSEMLTAQIQFRFKSLFGAKERILTLENWS